MSDVLVRGLSKETISLLKARARRNGRSMQAELKNIVEQAARAESVDTEILSGRIRRMLEGRSHSDSAGIEE